MSRAHRIHIIGGPGSGKTTLARRLGAELAIPVHELDAIGYEAGAGAKRALPDKIADIGAIAVREAWITEGVFLGWTEELLLRADVIVWLDVPWRVAAWRILVRHARARLSGRNRHKGLRRLRRFLLNTRRYYAGPALVPRALDDDAAVTRCATAATLHAFHDKVVRCTSSKAVRAFLKAIRTTPQCA